MRAIHFDQISTKVSLVLQIEMEYDTAINFLRSGVIETEMVSTYGIFVFSNR